MARGPVREHRTPVFGQSGLSRCLKAGTRKTGRGLRANASLDERPISLYHSVENESEGRAPALGRDCSPDDRTASGWSWKGMMSR